MSIILIVLVIINLLLLFVFGILFFSGPLVSEYIPYTKNTIDKLASLYNDKDSGVNFINVITALGALIGFLILHLRNIAMTKQTEVQGDTFHKDKQFKNFLEATELLTGKDSTVEAKISAIFLLYDVAISYPEHAERVIQVINKQLTPLLKCMENNCEKNRYSSHLKEQIIVEPALRIGLSKTEIFGYKENQLVTIDAFNDSRVLIKEWQYKGNDTEKVIATALYILKKIILNVPKSKNHLDISNTIFFDIDSDFEKKSLNKMVFVSKGKPIENLIFFHCTFKKVVFNKTIYHYCKFIHCNLEGCNFKKANLWGTTFVNCNLDKVVFNKTECEGVEFKNFHNSLSIEQIQDMKFKNEKDNDKDYLIICNQKINNKEINCFKDKDEYKKWKDRD